MDTQLETQIQRLQNEKGTLQNQLQTSAADIARFQIEKESLRCQSERAYKETCDRLQKERLLALQSNQSKELEIIDGLKKEKATLEKQLRETEQQLQEDQESTCSSDSTTPTFSTKRNASTSSSSYSIPANTPQTVCSVLRSQTLLRSPCTQRCKLEPSDCRCSEI